MLHLHGYVYATAVAISTSSLPCGLSSVRLPLFCPTVHDTAHHNPSGAMEFFRVRQGISILPLTVCRHSSTRASGQQNFHESWILMMSLYLSSHLAISKSLNCSRIMPNAVLAGRNAIASSACSPLRMRPVFGSKL